MKDNYISFSFIEEGKKDHAENRKEKTTRKIKVESHDHLMFLKNLKFKDFFMQKHPSFDGEFRYDKDDSVFYLATSCTEEMKIEIEKTKNEFISSLKRIILDSKVKALLFEKDSKCASDFKQKLKDRKLNCFLIKPGGCIYTTPEYVEKVKEVVDEHFLCMTVHPEEPRYFHFTTENFQKFRIDHENKDFIFERNVGVISFAAVKSAVADELTEAMRLYESDKCKFAHTPMQTEAIQKWGPQKREDYWLFLNKLHSEGRYIHSRKAYLLYQKPTEVYVKQKLTDSKIRALFEVESDYRVNLIALNSIEADKAVKVLEDSIHEIPIYYTDTLVKDISSNDFKEHFDKWEGKYLFDGFETALQDPENYLLATDDIADDLKDLLNDKFCKQKSRGLEQTYKTDTTRAIINPDLFRGVEAEVNVRKIEEKYHCKISKEFLQPQLASCWLMRNEDSRNIRVHLIAGHAESLNVDAVVCPCTSVMFPVNDSFGLYSMYHIQTSSLV